MSAASINIASSGIVVEVLSRENYSNWSALVRNYLKGHGLWYNIIEERKNTEVREKNNEEWERKNTEVREKNNEERKNTEVREKNNEEWERKNSMALHAIQLSCGNHAMGQIRDSIRAKDAWNQLENSFGEEVTDHRESDQTRAISSSSNNQKCLQNLVRKGFLEEVKSLMSISPEDVFSRSPEGRTALHVAVAAGHVEIVKKLVKMGKQRLLKMQDKKGYTALALAAKLTDNKKMAEWMVDNGGEELLVLTVKSEAEDDSGVDEIPVLLASAKGHKDMTRYLFTKTPWSLLRQNRWKYGVVLLSRCIYKEIFDVAAAILQHPDAGNLPLHHPKQHFQPIYALAHTPSAFAKAGTQLNWWRHFIYIILRLETNKVFKDERIEIVSHAEPDKGQSIMTYTLAGRLFGQFQQFVQTNIVLKLPVFKKIYEEKEDHFLVLEILKCLCNRISSWSEEQLHKASVYDAMLQASKYGITEFIESMSAANPDLLSAMDKNKRGIFEHAIMNRQEKVFQFIHQMLHKDIIASRNDVLGNSMLHIAAQLGPSRYLDRISNAALQMQRELQWFQEVKNTVPRWCHDVKDANGKMASEVFTDSHKELLKSGQQWAKETASSFTLVGTLIITIMFAAAFTVPGGNNSNNGIPVFLGKQKFTFFIISVALSLITSSSSVLMFIGILTSRYAEEDFITSLPLKLLFGLITLFFSVASMMCAFCAALALMLKGYYRIVIAAMWLALLPILVFVPSLLRLTSEIFQSTMRFDKLGAKKKRNQD